MSTINSGTAVPKPTRPLVVPAMIVPPVPTLKAVATVVTPDEKTSVAFMLPFTSSLARGAVDPMPTLSESAKIRFSATSRPFLTTKFLLTAIWSPEVHSPLYFLLFRQFFKSRSTCQFQQSYHQLLHLHCQIP